MNKVVNKSTNKVMAKGPYNKKNHRHFNLFHMFRKTFLIYFVLLMGIVLLYMAIKSSLSADATANDSKMVLYVAVASLLTVPVIILGRITFTIRSEAKKRGDTIEIIEVTKDKIVRRIEGIEGKIVFNWKEIASVYELKNLFLIYTTADQGFIISKEDIVEGDNELLRKLFKNYLYPNKRGKTPFKSYCKESKDASNK